MIHTAAKLAEERTVKRLGLKPTVASGILSGDPADAKDEVVRMEIKTTIRDTLRVDSRWLLKIFEEAMTKNQMPVLSMQFINENGEPRPGLAWVAVPEHLWTTLRRALDEYSKGYERF